MSSDGPIERELDERELADIKRDRDAALEAEDSYDAWWDKQLDRADFARDQARDAAFDVPDNMTQAEMLGHFLDRILK
jgi:hypothetical protein